jgi:hypothetical protein
MASDNNTPPFLKGNPAASGSAPKEMFPNRPQKDGSMSDDGSDEKMFPNRPQPMKEDDQSSGFNPKSVPDGGKLPYTSPSVPTKTPFKLGK